MNRAMYASASGMAAQQTNLEVIADNLANADVAGFKQMAARFTDVRAGGTIGLGTASAGRHALFGQGKLMHGGGPFDVAIDGDGFFRVERNGVRGYTRNGAFARGADGSLATADGWRLRDIAIPADALAVRVAPDGRVSIDTPLQANVEVGRIALATFPAPESLRSLGATVFAATREAGAEQRVVPGHTVRLAFGMLEQSNVSVIESMMQILTAQRAYEANAKGVQAAETPD